MNYEDRTFGVEIECGTNGKGISGTQRLLGNNGLSAWCRGMCRDGSEIEIKSPILKGTKGLKELKKVMNLLQENGYYTGTYDGMHCHFGAEDLSEHDILRVIQSWDANKDVVREFLGSRFNNGFCSYGYDFDYLEQGINDSWRSSVWRYDGQKQYAIEPRQHLRTLEFRQHFGTLNFEDARAWILLVQAFIKTVKNKKSPLTKVSMEELFTMTRTYKIAQRNLTSRKFSFGVRQYAS